MRVAALGLLGIADVCPASHVLVNWWFLNLWMFKVTFRGADAAVAGDVAVCRGLTGTAAAAAAACMPAAACR
jgi:hypothetical protein